MDERLRALSDSEGRFARDLGLELHRVLKLKSAARDRGGRSHAGPRMARLAEKHGIRSDPNGWLDVLVGTIWLQTLQYPLHEAIAITMAQMPPTAADLLPLAAPVDSLF